MIDRVLDYYSMRVWIDFFPMLVVLALTLTFQLSFDLDPAHEGSFFSFLTAIVSFSSIVVAVSVFACSLMYQSSSSGLEQVRRIYAEELRKNWTSVLSWSLFAGAVSVVGVGVAAAGHQAAGLILATNSGSWALIKGARGLVWFVSSLFLLEEDDMKANFPTEIFLNHREKESSRSNY